MEIEVLRYFDTGDETYGCAVIDGKPECTTLEDEFRKVKIAKETRIPEGKYKIKLRTFGGHHIKYAQKFGAFHKGMLHIADVPGFQDILIHIGNYDEDTAGCLLLGTGVNYSKKMITGSTDAYIAFYAKVIGAIQRNEEVWISFKTPIYAKIN